MNSDVVATIATTSKIHENILLLGEVVTSHEQKKKGGLIHRIGQLVLPAPWRPSVNQNPFKTTL